MALIIHIDDIFRFLGTILPYFEGCNVSWEMDANTYCRIRTLKSSDGACLFVPNLDHSLDDMKVSNLFCGLRISVIRCESQLLQISWEYEEGKFAKIKFIGGE